MSATYFITGIVNSAPNRQIADPINLQERSGAGRGSGPRFGVTKY